VTLLPNTIHLGDCVEKLKKIKAGSVDLVFADPPFNIGYEYDVYNDQRSRKEYQQWCRKWMSQIHRVLKPSGTFWLAIGDEYAAELKVLAADSIGFHCRSWVIWYYTFGVNCVRAFSRSHTHLFHFVKDPEAFTFNAENPALRVLSARQLVYADARANSKGRLPDNTWILRPQDLAGSGFFPEHDTWYFARVAGTFKEREGFHGCQMPEQLLGRIIRASSNPQDLVVDPFAGSGTTLTVAKKLGRQWLGIELSRDYVKKGQARLGSCRPGDELDGPKDPVRSAPKTSQGKKKIRLRNGRPVPLLDEETAKGIVDAYGRACKGHSTDMILCDPDLNKQFVGACRKNSLRGDANLWNRLLLRIRKQGKLPRVKRTGRRTTFEEMDNYSHASEIALQLLGIDYGVSLDEILCSPEAASRFDQLAGAFAAEEHTPFEYRWAALAIRKRAKKSKKLAKERFQDWLNKSLPRKTALDRCLTEKYEHPGVFLLLNRNKPLYVGETFSVRRRIEKILRTDGMMQLGPESVRIVRSDDLDMQHGLQSVLIQRTNAPLNSELLRSQCVVVS